jgi:hypothetical protein
VTPIPAVTQHTIKELLALTSGSIQFIRFYQGAVVALAYENNQVYCYIREKTGTATKKLLFHQERGMRFELIDQNTLAINRSGSSDVEVWDISAPRPRLVTSTYTELFAENDQRQFRGSNGKLIRIVQRAVKNGEVAFGSELVERDLPLLASGNQTTFWSDQNADTHLFLSHIFEEQRYAVVHDGLRYDAEVHQLNQHESQEDVSVRFGGKSILIRRLTKESNQSYLRTDILSLDGSVIHSSRVKRRDHKQPIIRGHAYADHKGGYTVFHPTDDGLLREDIAPLVSDRDQLVSTFTLLGTTDKVVSAADKLIHIANGKHFLVVSRTTVEYLVLS